MNTDTINRAIQAAFVADAYSLGSHWVYDEAQLETLPIEWESLNAPQAMWHKGKSKGDCTHYGDHGKWLYEFIQQNGRFDITMYSRFWLDHMREYKGYIDGSSREAMEALKLDPNTQKASTSHDLSIIGRIAPLLLVSNSKEEFLKQVDSFVAFTHNAPVVLTAAAFFAAVLYDVTEGKSIDKALRDTDIGPILKTAYDEGMNSKGQETFSAIRNFGPACGVEGGFEGSLHLLISYDDFKEAMIANAKAGGDTSARAMIVAMIMGAAGVGIPSSWAEGTKVLG